MRAFEAAARRGSMTLAGDELGVTPGAVSRQVRELEGRMGAALFLRTPQGLALTDTGETLFRTAREALDALAAATGSIRSRARRRLTLGIYGHFLTRTILPEWEGFCAVAPEREIEVHTSVDPLELSPGRFDAVVAVIGPRALPGLTARTLMEIRSVPVCAPAMLSDGPFDPRRAHLLHTRARPDDWRRWLDHAGFGNVPVRGGAVFDTALPALEAAAAGMGAVVGMEGLLGPDLASGRLVLAHPDARPTRRRFALVADARGAADPDVIALGDWLESRFAPDAGPCGGPGLKLKRA